MTIKAVAFDVGGVLERVGDVDLWLEAWRQRLGCERRDFDERAASVDPQGLIGTGGMTEAQFRQGYVDAFGFTQAGADEFMAAKVAKWGPEVMRYVEKSVLLQTLDQLWREHLIVLEHLRQVIGLRGYGQRDPLNEYKAEAFTLFETMIARLREAVTAQLMRVEIVQGPGPDDGAQQLPYMEAHKVDPSTGEDEFSLPEPALISAGAAAVAPVARNPNDPTTWGKVGRNEVCPCGSGKKYKHCHGKFG